MKKQVRITRTITYTGPEDVVTRAISKAYIKDDFPFVLTNLKITSNTGESLAGQDRAKLA